LLGVQPYQEVYKIANNISKKRDCRLYRAIESHIEILDITREIGWSHYLYENTLLAISALDILNFSYSIEDIKNIRLFGRFYSIAPNVIIDVGHNLLAAKAVARALEQRFSDRRVVLVYNSLNDKDYGSVLKRLKKHIKRVEIIPIETNRVVDVTILQDKLKQLTIEYREFKTINNYEDYLIFGSFFVVEAFIKNKSLQI
jgi:dihydrofolate synthase/folylpolyglutamate synthase